MYVGMILSRVARDEAIFCIEFGKYLDGAAIHISESNRDFLDTSVAKETNFSFSFCEYRDRIERNEKIFFAVFCARKMKGNICSLSDKGFSAWEGNSDRCEHIFPSDA